MMGNDGGVVVHRYQSSRLPSRSFDPLTAQRIYKYNFAVIPVNVSGSSS